MKLVERNSELLACLIIRFSLVWCILWYFNWLMPPERPSQLFAISPSDTLNALAQTL